LAWYDPAWLYRQKITIDHTLVAEDLTDFPVLITDAVVQASLFAHAAPQAKDSTLNAVHGTYDIAGATVHENALWGGRCILFDNGPRLLH
jgi:hypothetical protein